MNPPDVCHPHRQALLAYLDSGLNIKAYWEHLESNGITKERLLSYDRCAFRNASCRMTGAPMGAPTVYWHHKGMPLVARQVRLWRHLQSIGTTKECLLSHDRTRAAQVFDLLFTQGTCCTSL
eukprot:1160961-Pelagomonas_calceolata.AAC.3